MNGPLQSLAETIRDINSANGWNVTVPDDWDNTYKVPAILALEHSEVSEALEAFRSNDLTNFLEEQADVLIRVLDCVGAFTADFDAIVEAKLEKNRGRGYRHGGKKV
jgi:NTP pyrophosphatase (non-canonical NTP hydrolase)